MMELAMRAVLPGRRPSASYTMARMAVKQAPRRVAGANTNLGIALLLAPLARAALTGADVGQVLNGLTVADAEAAYAAIRLAAPGGLEAPVEHDVRDAPAVTLLAAMTAAAERDSIAAEYSHDFSLTHGI